MPDATPTVLIVGAGALGTIVGYFLALGGTAVTYLVRPSRKAEMPVTQQLYCYDDGELKDFGGYDVKASIDALGGRRFSHVLVTLDGAACRTGEGKALIRELADAIRDTDAVMLLCGVSRGLRNDVVSWTGLPSARVLEGTLTYMCHPADAPVPACPPIDPATLGKATFAYRHLDNQGFMLVGGKTPQALAFAEVYARSGKTRCLFMGEKMNRGFTAAFFAFVLGSTLGDWPTADQLRAKPELLSLTVKAMREVVDLPGTGLPGKILKMLISRRSLLSMLHKTEQGMLPFDFTAFNRYHHGNKVFQQDADMIRECLLDGERTGRTMSSVRELLRRIDFIVPSPDPSLKS